MRARAVAEAREFARVRSGRIGVVSKRRTGRRLAKAVVICSCTHPPRRGKLPPPVRSGPLPLLFCALLGACGERSVSEPAPFGPTPQALFGLDRTKSAALPGGSPSAGEPGLAPALTPTAAAESPPPRAPCPDLRDTPIVTVKDPAAYSVRGYLGRTLRIRRENVEYEHCVVVLWPPGPANSDGEPSTVGQKIDAAWFRMIENTLQRIPLSHVETLHRVVIDNQPKLHGLAAFDRRDPEDGRDGHTIWLNEHLFTSPDHWVHANTGSYFSYHSNQPGERFDSVPAEHDLFSPVLLHEIGHLVMYHLVNPKDEENATPECARSCGDENAGCRALSRGAKENNCISPYCRPFGFPGSTENWAELYRFYYQSSTTRKLLQTAKSKCFDVLETLDEWKDRERKAWPFGLPDAPEFYESRWDSCGGRACKEW
jgi:hypothetical protein